MTDEQRLRGEWKGALHAMSLLAIHRERLGSEKASKEIEHWARRVKRAGSKADLREIQNKLSWISFSPSVETFGRPWIKG